MCCLAVNRRNGLHRSHSLTNLTKSFHSLSMSVVLMRMQNVKNTTQKNMMVSVRTGLERLCGVTPPYGREMPKWIKKCSEHISCGKVAVMLIPARTDTRAFHDYIYHKSEIRFVKGRLKFGDGKNSAPFPSMVVVFRPGYFERDDHYVERLIAVIESCIDDTFSEIQTIMSILQENRLDDGLYISSLNNLTDSINNLRKLEGAVRNGFVNENDKKMEVK